MNFLISFVLLPASILFSCAESADKQPNAQDVGPVEGFYEGYRSVFSGQQTATDSTKIKLKVSRLSDGKLEILQTSPNEFKYLVTVKDGSFTYDLGLGEAACGVTHISGTGYIRGDQLFLREKSECKNAKTAGANFIQLRAQKQ